MAEMVDKKPLSNGQIAVCLRPQGVTDASHDSWHTYNVSPATTASDIRAWIAQKKAEVDTQAQAMQQADSLLGEL